MKKPIWLKCSNSNKITRDSRIFYLLMPNLWHVGLWKMYLSIIAALLNTLPSFTLTVLCPIFYPYLFNFSRLVVLFFICVSFIISILAGA